MVKLNKRILFLIAIVIAILIICFTYYFNGYHMKDNLVICYNKIVPDYEPNNILIKDREYYKLFEDMLNESQEQYRGKNTQQSAADKKLGSFISFELSGKDNKTVYILRGSDLYVYIYQNSDTNSTSISESIIYKVPEKYYEKWVEYCLNH